MPLKSRESETVPAGELGAIPPSDYCPGRSQWCDDAEDVFFVPAELRADYCRPDAPPADNQTRRLWAGGIQLNRVIRDGKRFVWAPPIVNSGALAQLRPTSPDVIEVDPLDELHVAAWRHMLRRDWSERQLRVTEEIRRQDEARPRCRICGTVLVQNASQYGPWTQGAPLCPACAEAVNLAGAMRHLDEHRDAIARWLEPPAAS
jgi:hypothetical protein